jgi:YD repeat-containing protein
VPNNLTVQLTFNGSAGTSYMVQTSGSTTTNFMPGDTLQIGLQVNASSFSTGRYSYSFQVVDTNATPQTTTYSGSVDVLNYGSSPLGAGWAVAGLERIYPVTGGVILDLGDGQSLWFANGSSAGTFVRPPGDFSTLTQNTTTQVYTRTMPDGTQYVFNSSGYQTSLVDRNGNTTSYGYVGAGLNTITDFNNQVTTLTYNPSNKVTLLTDPANRSATLSYDSSGRQTSYQDLAVPRRLLNFLSAGVQGWNAALQRILAGASEKANSS